MGWIDKKPKPHRCAKPGYTRTPDEITYGSIWECDDCGQQWKWTVYDGWVPVLFRRRLKEPKA